MMGLRFCRPRHPAPPSRAHILKLPKAACAISVHGVSRDFTPGSFTLMILEKLVFLRKLLVYKVLQKARNAAKQALIRSAAAET